MSYRVHRQTDRHTDNDEYSIVAVDKPQLTIKKTRDTGAFTRITKFVETLGPAITSVNTREDLTHRYVQIQMSLAEDLQKYEHVSTFLTMLLKSDETVNVNYTPTHRNILIQMYKYI